jgi:Uma2 family endonuclease
MPRIHSPFPKDASLADVLKQLGGISPRRIRIDPPPGKATERDLLALLDHSNRRCELVDGTLVEKILGYEEGYLALWLGGLLSIYAEEHDLGIAAGADATLRLMPGLVRIPDISFVGWGRLPRRKCPTDPIPNLVPHLAVEVLSEGNTSGEMKRKLKEYFLAGVQQVWIVDPSQRTVDVHEAPDQSIQLAEADTLDGGPLLPGFQLPLTRLFARIDAPRAGRGGRRRSRGNARRRKRGRQ